VARVPIDIPPGLLKNGTEYSAAGRWRNANLVRFRGKTIGPVGGWKKSPLTVGGFASTDLAGYIRAAITWRANDQSRYMACGSTRKLYSFDGAGFTDITPAGFTVGSDDVAVGKGYGAYQYGKQNYGTARTVSSITSEPGRWTLDTFGQNLYAMANSDGRLHKWPLTGIAAPETNAPTNNRSFVVTNERHIMLLGAGDGPTGGGAGVYTPNPRHVWWCSQEDPTDWDRASATNSAGDFNLDTAGQIMCGVRFAGDIYIFTDQDVFRCQYVGPPYYYGFHQLRDGCGLIGPGALAETPAMLAWMGINGFWAFDGYVKSLPCDVQDFLFGMGEDGGDGDLNVAQSAKVHGAHNSAFNEIWWFYPSVASDECDSYVVWNYAENHWNTGRLARTCWTDANVWPKPLAFYGFRKVSDGLTYSWLYQHEQGWLDDNAARPGIFLESAPFEIGSGDTRMFIDRIIQDVEPDKLVDVSVAPVTPPVTLGATGATVPPTIPAAAAFSVTLRARNAPGKNESTKTVVIDTTRGYSDIRMDGRQFVMRINQLIDGPWRAGRFRLNAKPSSGR
jgi:hypothetical protein